jgi:hypothetical protein
VTDEEDLSRDSTPEVTESSPTNESSAETTQREP